MGSLEAACITGFLCRLCSKMHRTVIHIYGEEGMRHKLEQKINNYLPVTVTPTDLLPKTVCKHCLQRVEQHHKLMRTIAQNHLKFQKLQSRTNIALRQQRPLRSNSHTHAIRVEVEAPPAAHDESTSTSTSSMAETSVSILSTANNLDQQTNDEVESLVESTASE